MPNWVTNTVKIYGEPEAIKALKAKLKTQEEVFDFDTIIPRPLYLTWLENHRDLECNGDITKEILKSLYYRPNITDEQKKKIDSALSASNLQAQGWLHEEFVKHDEMEQIVQKHKKLLQEYMSVLWKAVVEEDELLDWYNWQCKHWDTKWNACHAQLCDENYNETSAYLEYTFDTAWSRPEQVIEAFAEQNPDMTIEYSWIEEQGVVDLGEEIYENGALVSENIPEECSKEAYEMMFNMWENSHDYFYNPEEDNYEYNCDEYKYLYGFYEDGEYIGSAAGNNKKEAIANFKSNHETVDMSKVKVKKIAEKEEE